MPSDTTKYEKDNRIIEITEIVKSVFAALQHLAKHFSVDGNTQSDGTLSLYPVKLVSFGNVT